MARRTATATTPQPYQPIDDEFWEGLKPLCMNSGKYTRRSIIDWARAAHAVIEDVQHHYWRRRLTELRERCINDPEIELPYTIAYLMQLAETYEAVSGNFDLGVPITVLVEGRRLDDLLDIIKREPDISVARMKAHVAKQISNDPKIISQSVDEIEADLREQRKSPQARKRAETEPEPEPDLSEMNPSELTEEMVESLQNYQLAFVRMTSSGEEIDRSDLAALTITLRNMLAVVEELTVPLVRLPASGKKRRKRASVR